MKRRNYRNNLKFITHGFSTCRENACALVEASKVLLDRGYHAQALSLSVLALEELGKLSFVDGLLFAKSNDYKAEAFTKSLKNHSHKLSALSLFSFLLLNIARTDPRFTNEVTFKKAFVIGIADLRDRGNVVFSLTNSKDFSGLDKWKQAGFYSQLSNNVFVKPSDAVSVELAESVYMFAWRATSTLDYLLSNGNLERYIKLAKKMRTKMSEDDHNSAGRLAEQIVNDLFSFEDNESSQE